MAIESFAVALERARREQRAPLANVPDGVERLQELEHAVRHEQAIDIADNRSTRNRRRIGDNVCRQIRHWRELRAADTVHLASGLPPSGVGVNGRHEVDELPTLEHSA